MAQLFGLARLGRDTEIRYTSNGDAVCTLALAFEYGKKVDGKKPVQWVDAALWGGRAEALAQYLVKGQQVAVTVDDVRIDTYEKNDGSLGSKLVGRVSEINFAGSAPQAQAAAKQPAQPPRKPQQPPRADDDFDDDIPF